MACDQRQQLLHLLLRQPAAHDLHGRAASRSNHCQAVSAVQGWSLTSRHRHLGHAGKVSHAGTERVSGTRTTCASTGVAGRRLTTWTKSDGVRSNDCEHQKTQHKLGRANSTAATSAHTMGCALNNCAESTFAAVTNSAMAVRGRGSAPRPDRYLNACGTVRRMRRCTGADKHRGMPTYPALQGFPVPASRRRHLLLAGPSGAAEFLSVSVPVNQHRQYLVVGDKRVRHLQPAARARQLSASSPV